MYKNIYKQSGIYPDCKEMDIYLTSLGFTEDTLKHIQNPCNMHDSYLMNDISKASDILWDAIQRNLNICIIGDYDADGTNSTSTLYLTLQYCDAQVDYIIPHRILDGYGLSCKLVDKAIEKGADVILTCDNGDVYKRQYMGVLLYPEYIFKVFDSFLIVFVSVVMRFWNFFPGNCINL